MSEIVVGVDLASASQAAVGWAAEQARMTGADLRGVHTLLLPSIGVVPGGWTSVALPVDDKVDKACRDAVTAIWEAVKPEPGWRLEFYHGEPGRLLVAESSRADLLVVGTRDHIGWGRVLNGSISHFCLSHATCPVVAVPPAGAVIGCHHSKKPWSIRTGPVAEMVM